jgi:hypothetical protein
VKGTGEGAIANIVAAREAGGPFKDLADFCRRVDRRIVNRRAMEALVKSGSFDSIEPNRASLLASLGAAIDLAEKEAHFAQQTSLFGGAGESAEAFELARAAPWSERDRLQNEKQSLGFYLSGHPFNAYREELRRFARISLGSLNPAERAVYVAGVIYGVTHPQFAPRAAWRCSRSTTAPGASRSSSSASSSRRSARSSRKTGWSWCRGARRWTTSRGRTHHRGQAPRSGRAAQRLRPRAAPFHQRDRPTRRG